MTNNIKSLQVATGTLYSEIIHNEFESKDIYTLIGWDGNNNTSTKNS